MSKVSVLGAGSWGTALAILLCNNGHDVVLWSYSKSGVERLQKDRENKGKLPGIAIQEKILITDNIEQAVKDKELIVLAVPSIHTRNIASSMKPYIREGQIVVTVSKGIEDNTLKTLTEQIEEELPEADVAVLSGPSHAEEVGKGLPTTCVAGAKTRKTAEFIQTVFMNEAFRVYTSSDVLGIEIGGALKNVIALAAGAADGLGYGDNTKAALITRGIAEITRLGVKMGGKRESFSGLTGIGDLIVTCASIHSRNRKAGFLIGQGMTMEEAMKEVNMVVEGVYSAKAALKLSQKYDVSMPIVEQINKVLFENKSASEAVKDLMMREGRSEMTALDWK